MRATKILSACVVAAMLSSSMFTGAAVNADTLQDQVSEHIETLFNITTSTDGTKHGILYQMKDGVETQDATLYTAYNNPDVLEYISKNDSELREVASYVFSDVTSDAWYSSFVPIAAYFNVLSGYDDGTLKPDNNITAAELAKVVSSAFEANIENEYWDRLDDGTNNWYGKYYHSCAQAFTYTSSTDMTSNYFDRAVTRAEIAYVLANYVDAGSGELQTYIDKAKSGDISSLSRFTDTINLSTEDDGTCEKDLELLSEGVLPSRMAGSLAYLVDKGIFEGNENNELLPTENVTRAQVFTLITKVCKATSSYTFGQFSNATEGNTVSSGSTTSTSSTSHSSHSSSSSGASGLMPGDEGYYDGRGETYEAYQSRENVTVSWNDSSRPRLKAGDTFIAEDGTAYVLEVGASGVLGEGLPIATDLGRVNSLGGTVVDGFKTNSQEFGWINSDVNTCGYEYWVYKTGEGHWEIEWSMIQNNTRPTYDGEQGQWSEDGYWVWNAGRWVFAPLNVGVWNM